MTPEHWKQIKETFQSLVECAPPERAARLDEVCAGDAELRRELELLLASDEQARSFMEVPPVKISQDSISPLEGRTIGPYRIVSLLGRGGMGEVYQARDSRLDRTVALKILPADVAGDQERMKRFVNEAKAASALSHPNVATIYDYDIGERDGIAYIAMEYVEGETLEQRMNGRPMSAIEIRTVARQVAKALEAAHSKGITHRDIKPANLMITPRGEVKVLDFGLAKMSREAPVTGLTAIRTLPGVLMGTVEYMSPEQALGRNVDYRTDIFSLGVVLYEMATGRSPNAAFSIGETIDRILHFEPEPISRLNPGFPLELERVIQRCLEKERERRYQSAPSLLADLREGRPAGRPATASLRTIRELILRPKWMIAFGVVGLLAGLVTLALETHRSSSPAPAPDTIDRMVEIQGNTIPAGTESVTPNGGIPTIVDTVYNPSAIAVDAAGNIYIADTDGGRLFKVTTSGTVLIIAGTGTPGFAGDGGPATSAQLMMPLGLAVDAANNVYIAHAGSPRIRKVTPGGVITTIAGNGTYGFSGDGGQAIRAQLSIPRNLAVDPAGNLYFSDSTRVRKITSDGIIRTVADLTQAAGNNSHQIWGLTMDQAGQVYFADYNDARVLKVMPDGTISAVAGNGTPAFGGDGGPATSAQLNHPLDVAMDPAGNLYIADVGNYRVRKVTRAGVISTVAGVDVFGVDAYAGLATAAWIYPYQLATDATGNIYILQYSGNRQTVLKVTPAGRISTAVAWRGDLVPVRVGEHGINPARISTAATLRSDGEMIYSEGTPQIIIESTTSRVDATVSFNPVNPLRSNCQVIFEISNAESPTKPEFSQRGTPPTIKITGELKPGLHNLVTRFPADGPRCDVAPSASGTRLLLRYVVTVTPR